MYPSLNQEEINFLWELDSLISRAEKLGRELRLIEARKAEDYEYRRRTNQLSQYERDSTEERARRRKEEDAILEKAEKIKQSRNRLNSQSIKSRGSR